MKKLLLLFLLLSTNFAFCQTLKMDTTSIMLRGHEQRLNTIQLQLENFHQQYQTGTIVLFSGLFVSLVGVGVSYYYPDSDAGLKAGGVVIGVGALAAFAGALIQIDSHKYIRRASRH